MSILEWIGTVVAGVASMWGVGYFLVKLSMRNRSDDIHANHKSIIVFNTGKGTVNVGKADIETNDKERFPPQEAPHS